MKLAYDNVPVDVAASHPSRGAWIEMDYLTAAAVGIVSVAPLAGCVD